MIKKVIISSHPADDEGNIPDLYEHEGYASIHGNIRFVYFLLDELHVILAKPPARIDYDPYLNTLIPVDDERAKESNKPRTILLNSPKPGITVWQREVTPVAKA